MKLPIKRFSLFFVFHMIIRLLVNTICVLRCVFSIFVFVITGDPTSINCQENVEHTFKQAH